MLPGAQRRQDRLTVGIIGRTDMDQLDVVPLKQFPNIGRCKRKPRLLLRPLSAGFRGGAGLAGGLAGV